MHGNGTRTHGRSKKGTSTGTQKRYAYTRKIWPTIGVDAHDVNQIIKNPASNQESRLVTGIVVKRRYSPSHLVSVTWLTSSRTDSNSSEGPSKTWRSRIAWLFVEEEKLLPVLTRGQGRRVIGQQIIKEAKQSLLHIWRRRQACE